MKVDLIYLMVSGFVDINDYRERYRVLVIKKLVFRKVKLDTIILLLLVISYLTLDEFSFLSMK